MYILQFKSLIFLTCLIIVTSLVTALPSPQQSSASKPPSPIPVDQATANRIITLTKYNGASYCDPSSWTTWNCTICQDPDIRYTRDVIPIISDASAGFQGLAGVNDNLKSIIVAFRGSQSFSNWVADFLFAKTKVSFENGNVTVSVHEGFVWQWRSVTDLAKDAVVKLQNANPGYDVTFTGHSIGGSVAALTALDLLDKGVITAAKTHVDTTGQPRTGDAAFSDYFNSRGFASVSRTVNQND
ncbi:hypothetical protein HDU76_009118, partial [Blyttiomyces sp. JEL0837]